MRPSLLISLAALAAACTQPGSPGSPQRPATPADTAGNPVAAALAADPSSPLHRLRWLHQRQADENGRVLPGVRSAALAQRRANLAMAAMRDDTGVSPNDWTECGPSNIGGRTRALWIDPANQNRLIGGSSGGGLWLSTNRGASWSPINDSMGNLNVSCLAQAPSNANVLFAGTGEGYIDYLVGPGEGIWKSTDRGASWTQLASTAAFGYVNRVAVHPTNPQIVLAACNDGLRRSTDGGSTWSQWSSGRIQMVAFSPHDGNQAAMVVGYSGSSMFQVSTDAGQTFSLGASAFFANSGRFEFAYSTTTPGAMVLVRENASGGATAFRSTNYGASWSTSSLGTIPGNQWFYDNAVWISPSDPLDWVIGGTSIFRAIDPTLPTAALQSISNGGANLNTPHSDVHAFANEPGWGTNNNTVFYACTDGGIYRAEHLSSATPSAGWTRLDNQYRTTQFYSVAGHANGRVTGGTQDNGWLTVQPGQTTAVMTAGGDGGFVSIDPTNPNYQYGEYQWMSITRSSDGGQTAQSIGPFHSTLNGLPADQRSLFIAPVVMSPTEPQALFAGGYRLYRTTDAKAPTPTWDMARDRFVSGGYYQPITAVAVSSINPALVYLGYPDGSVFVSSTGLDPVPVWQTLDGATVPNRYCHRLLPDHTVLGRVYAAFGGYTAGNLWRFDVNTSSWTNISGAGATALPAAPVYGIAQHPNDPDLLYVGTEVGLFASDDGGLTWSSSNQGPSDSAVYDVQFVPNTATLLLGTYGRGIWKTNIFGATSTALGTGCAGSAGMPNLSSTLPRLGSTVTLTASNLPANRAGWLGQGFSTTSWFGNPLPFHLTGFGAPNCWLRISLDYLRDAPSGAGGTFTTNLAIANDPVLIDQQMRFQYFAADPTANLMGTTTSNALELTIGY